MKISQIKFSGAFLRKKDLIICNKPKVTLKQYKKTPIEW